MRKLIFVMTAGLFSIHSRAQTDSSGKLLDEAIVTANKFERKQSQTGKVVTVISKQQLEKNYGKSLGQLLNEQAGLVVNGSMNAPGTVQTVYMRGAATGRVLILIDGIPVGDPSMISNEFDLNFIAVHDIERIEILKGAQSTLYGSDAIAGAINIITVKKDIKRPVQVKLTTIRGNKGLIRDHVNLYGRLKNFQYTVRNSIIRTDGFSPAHDSTGNKDFDRDGNKGRSTDIVLRQQFTPAFSARLFFRQSQYEADIDAGTFRDEKDYIIRNRNLSTGAAFQYKKTKLEINGHYQFTDAMRKYANDSGFVNPFGIKYERNRFDSRSQFVELYGNNQASKNLVILVGTDYRWAIMSQDYYSLSSFGPYASSFGDTSLNQFSVYSSLLLNTSDRKLNIEAGGRFNHHSKYGSNATFTFNPSWSLHEHWRVFGSLASGYKAPSIFQVYDAYSGNPSLEPEESFNVETGIQYLQDKINARAVYFHRSIKNGIDFNYISYKYFNFIQQQVSGFELEVNAKPISKLALNANYTYLAGKEKTQSRKDFQETTYNYLLRRPKHAINLSLGYNITDRLFSSISLKYSGKRFDAGGFMTDDVELENYVLVNAYAEYKCKKIKIFTDLQNLGGKKFFDVWGYNSIPFMFSLGISAEL